MDTLEDKWKYLTLIEVEGEEITINEQEIAAEIKIGENSIIGRVLIERSVNKDVSRNEMLRAWKLTKSFNIVEIKPNLYIFSFENREDKEKVIKGRPWLFDFHLLAIQAFDGSIPPSKMKFKQKDSRAICMIFQWRV